MPGSYFVRHTRNVLVRREDIERMWEEDRAAVHFPGDTANNRHDSESLEPADYVKRDEKGAIGAFKELAERGGYVWVQSFVSDKAKVGYVRGEFEGGSGARMERAIWELRGKNYPGRRDGDPATLKTVRMEGVVEVGKGEQMDLRARRPQRVAASRWNVGERLREVVEGRPREMAWSSLSPAEQEAACAEFLRERHPGRKDLPVLKRLLLPVGRGLEDVDVFGIAEDGSAIFAQVTNYRVGTRMAAEKEARLVSYAEGGERGSDGDVRLVFFGVGEAEATGDGIPFVSADQEVWSWILGDPDYHSGLFGNGGEK